jgi:hypothetical protein
MKRVMEAAAESEKEAENQPQLFKTLPCYSTIAITCEFLSQL